jgi:hypothetical protein
MALLIWYHHRSTTHWIMTTIALVYQHPLVPLTCPLRYLISSSRSSCSIMRITHKAGAPYDYMTPRPTRDGDFAAQRILLMRLPLGDTAYCWFMGAVHLALISSLWGAPYAP